MHCIKCGQELSSSQSSCPSCGHKDNSDEPSVTTLSASQYTSPTYEISNDDVTCDSANKCYKNVDQFYRPHNLPHSNRRGNRKRRRRKGRKKLLNVVLPIITIVISLLVVFAAFQFRSFSNSNINIKGSWVAAAGSDASEGAIYLFANDGFVTVRDSEFDRVGTKYCWRLEGNKLIVDNTTYRWSTDLNQYSNAGQEYWCVSGTTIYISNTADNGYKILNKMLN